MEKGEPFFRAQKRGGSPTTLELPHLEETFFEGNNSSVSSPLRERRYAP
jgi:hypothetical protein